MISCYRLFKNGNAKVIWQIWNGTGWEFTCLRFSAVTRLFFEENIWFCKSLRKDESCIFTVSCIDLLNKYVYMKVIKNDEWSRASQGRTRYQEKNDSNLYEITSQRMNMDMQRTSCRYMTPNENYSLHESHFSAHILGSVHVFSFSVLSTIP